MRDSGFWICFALGNQPSKRFYFLRCILTTKVIVATTGQVIFCDFKHFSNLHKESWIANYFGAFSKSVVETVI